MTSNLLLSSFIKNSLLQNVTKRYIAKSSLMPKTRGGSYRLWAMPGEFIRRKELLAKQSIIKWHPGLNAGIDQNKSIYALCDGVFVITEERFDPDWDHPLVKYYYKDAQTEQKTNPSYMRFLHIIPKKRISEFKLIDLV